jgi:hypothetical protein
MSNKDVINVYWAPAIGYSANGHNEWEMLYPEPTNLYLSLLENKSNNIGGKGKSKTFFSCPAVKNQFKNTFVFKNVVQSEYRFDFSKTPAEIEPLSKSYIDFNVRSDFGLNVGPSITFELSYGFFADQPLQAFFYQPIFHKSQYTQYGTIFPGNFDIGRWFRSYNVEVQMWNQSGFFKFEEDEPLFYVHFNTDKKIKLHRFKHSRALDKYMNHCVNSPSFMGENLPLVTRYKKFMESRFNETILTEIKKNLTGEHNE